MKQPITRRNFLASTAAGLAATAAAGAERPRGTAPAGAPNILWLCTDQQRYDTITALGNKHLRTPNIDKLVAGGVTFTHAHCQSPICTPSRSSFLTGMYASAVHNCINGNDRWSEAAPLVTKLLADAGYDCGLAGKFHLAGAQGRIEPRPKDDGYRVFHWSHHPSDDWPEGHAYAEWLRANGQDYKTVHKRLGYIPTEFHQTTWCANEAIAFMKEKRRGPWLFSFNCFAPHPPFDPPEEFLKRFDVKSLPGPLFRDSDLAAQKRLEKINFQTKAQHPDKFDGRSLQARYWAQIELIDQNVGRMMRALEETGQRDNTIVIFTSDHGDATGDHGLRMKGCRFYEGLVRVPLIFSWPGRFKENLRSDALVELTDIAPTLLEAGGQKPPGRMTGRSLLPILKGGADARQHRDFVRSEYYKVLGGTPSYATMVRDRRHKLVNYHGTGLGELFDLEADPGEFDNLWDSPAHAKVRHEMMERNFDALALALDTGSPRVAAF